MANDRIRTDDDYGGPEQEPPSDMSDDRVRGGSGEDVRGVGDESEEDFEDMDDLEEDEDSDASF